MQNNIYKVKLKSKFLNVYYLNIEAYRIYVEKKREMKLNKKELEKFFKRLEELLEINGCNARDLTNAEIILDEMGVPKGEQDDFLEACRSAGGFCDCEIFLNAEEYLREKYSD